MFLFCADTSEGRALRGSLLPSCGSYAMATPAESFQVFFTVKHQVRIATVLNDMMNLTAQGGSACVKAIFAQGMIGQVCLPKV